MAATAHLRCPGRGAAALRHRRLGNEAYVAGAEIDPLRREPIEGAREGPPIEARPHGSGRIDIQPRIR